MTNTASQVERVAEALAEHPWIGRAHADAAGGVRVRPDDAALASGPRPGGLIAEYLDHWGELYDWTYTKAEVRHSPELDLSGWRASDTGDPFPTEHMLDWVERTVELALETRPQVVLELGCGTGLLAHRLRDRVRAYVGTDVAPTAVDTLAAAAVPGMAFVRAAAHEAGSDRVAAALAETAGAGVRPDCVLLNSVTQCFPDLGYLRAVLLEAISLVRPGGTVVVGDVRHAGLLARYCRWVERALDPEAARPQVEERAARRAERDDELLFDPPALAAVAAESPRDVRLDVRAKTMSADTELTRYRFDAVLTVDPDGPREEPPAVAWPGPGAASDPAAALNRLLAAGPVRVTGIPNGAAVEAEGAMTASELHPLVQPQGCVVLEPADPCALAVVSPRRAAARSAAEVAAAAGPGRAHEPLWGFVRRRLSEAARSHLRRHLPEARGTAITVETPAAAESGAAVPLR